LHNAPLVCSFFTEAFGRIILQPQLRDEVCKRLTDVVCNAFADRHLAERKWFDDNASDEQDSKYSAPPRGGSVSKKVGIVVVMNKEQKLRHQQLTTMIDWLCAPLSVSHGSWFLGERLGEDVAAWKAVVESHAYARLSAMLALSTICSLGEFTKVRTTAAAAAAAAATAVTAAASGEDYDAKDKKKKKAMETKASKATEGGEGKSAVTAVTAVTTSSSLDCHVWRPVFVKFLDKLATHRWVVVVAFFHIVYC
jgi:hypothetical protein